MPRWVSAILESSVVSLIARIMLTFMFWSSGIGKILDFPGGVAEMTHFHLSPPALFTAGTLVVQLVGSFLVIFIGRFAWLGAGMLATFTVLTIPIAHNFWAMSGPAATGEMYTAVEHISIIGALILVSMLRWRETAER